VNIKGRKGIEVFARDEHNRPETTAESLAKLKPAFRKDGTITTGNAPGLNSGAAAMIVAEHAWAERHGIEPMARLVAYGVGGVEPGFFGLGPVPAVRQALARAGWSVADVERIEINEAFAAITLACLRELGFAEDVANVEGGAIAHGHPIGATGAVLATRLLHSLRRDGLKRGGVAPCIGGCQGIALMVESLWKSLRSTKPTGIPSWIVSPSNATRCGFTWRRSSAACWWGVHGLASITPSRPCSGRL
jgi:acetyl-CoA C-acetyltransferase